MHTAASTSAPTATSTHGDPDQADVVTADQRPAAASTARRAPGRPRSERAHAAVLGATRLLLREEGYERLTIHDVARRAGVGKQTVYRWWPSKAALVTEAVLQGGLLPSAPLVPDTGDLDRDVRAWLGQVLSGLTDARVAALANGLASAAAEQPEDAERVHQQLAAPLHRTLERRLAAGAAAGETRPAADLGATVTVVVGVVVHAVISRARWDGRQVDAIADVLLHGVAAPR